MENRPDSSVEAKERSEKLYFRPKNIGKVGFKATLKVFNGPQCVKETKPLAKLISE